MKILPFLLLLGLTGCGPSNEETSTEVVLNLVPFGTSLALARQVMEEHQLKCTIIPVIRPTQFTNQAQWKMWNTPVVRGGKSSAVTNITALRCEKGKNLISFTLINGETSSMAIRGKFE